MNERGEVVGFADHMAAGEGCAVSGGGAAANTAQNDHVVVAAASFLGKLLAHASQLGLLGFQIEHDDVGMMLARECQAFGGDLCFENLHPTTSENGAQDFSIVGRRIDDQDAGL